MSIREALQTINSIPRERIGPKTVLSGPKGNEIIEVSPTVLAAATGLDPDLYALARVIESEEGSADASVLVAVAEIVRNRARYLSERDGKPKSILSLVLYDPDQGQSGHFGRQSGGRFVASTEDPTERSIAAAKLALEGETNLAMGAMRFFAPRSQDGGLQAGRKLKHDAIDIVKSWSESGYRWIKGSPLYQEYGVNPYLFMILGIPKMTGGTGPLASITETIRTIQRGRSGIVPKRKAPEV